MGQAAPSSVAVAGLPSSDAAAGVGDRGEGGRFHGRPLHWQDFGET